MNAFLTWISEYPNGISFGIILSISLLILIRSKSPRVLNTLPSFSTSVGVLFTFVVLWLNLSSDELKISNEKSVTDLVKELASAFSTSIIGIIGSIALSFIVKFRLDGIEKKNNWDQHPAKILKDLQTTIAQNQNGIENLTTSIKELANNLKTEFKDVFEELKIKIEEAVKELNTEAQDMYVKEMEIITRTVIEKYSEDIGKATTDLLEYLKGAASTLEIAFTNLEKMQNRAGTVLEESTQRFQDGVTEYSKLRGEAKLLMEESQQQSKDAAAMIENIQELLKHVNERSDGIQSMQQQLIDIGNVVQQLDRLKNSLDSISSKN